MAQVLVSLLFFFIYAWLKFNSLKLRGKVYMVYITPKAVLSSQGVHELKPFLDTYTNLVKYNNPVNSTIVQDTIYDNTIYMYVTVTVL